MVAPGILKYLQTGLAATPIVLERLCADLTTAQVDHRPDPERFTLREAMAHHADWERVWDERLNRMLDEDNPDMPGYDEGQWAIDNDYAHADFAEQLALFRSRREKLCAQFAALTPEQWMRAGLRDEIGSITVYDLAVHILGHDGYHLRQVVEFRPI